MSDPGTALAVAAAKPLVVKVLDALLTPAMKSAKAINDQLVDVFGDRFSEYLTRQLIKHSHLPTIVFQVRQPLEDIYVPLTVSEGASFLHDSEAQRFKLDRYERRFLPALKRVLVIDGAGMGKTTMSRFLFVQAIRTLATVPIFIELRHLSSDRLILDYMVSELNPVGADTKNQKIDRRQVTRLLDLGVFTFFLDGYDEVHSSHREAVTRDIKNVADSYPQNCFLVTSRPEHALASFPSFKIYRIEPLKKQEAFELIRRYDNRGERGEKLIEKLSDQSFREVDEFLRNPLLTTLLYRAYDYKNQIPLKKANFYRQVYDALFEWHDLTKDGYATREKSSKLDIDGFHKVLRGLGFISMMKGLVETDTDEMLQWIRNARTYAPELKFSESDFLEDAVKAVPVLRREGNSILWAHKSLAEYFSAQFIVSDSKLDQAGICEQLASSVQLSSFRNLLDLLYDMDIVVFSQYFIRPLIAFHAAEHKRLAALFPTESPTAITTRTAATFGRMAFFVAQHRKPTDASRRKQSVFDARVRAVSETAMRAWYNLPSQPEDDRVFDQRLGFDIHYVDSAITDDRRLISFTHALRTVFNVLAVKKHPLVLLPAFYPSDVAKARILGIRDADGMPINETADSTWNNTKNFHQTSLAMARTSYGILNSARIPSVQHEIDQLTSRSNTTASLLGLLETSSARASSKTS